MEAPTPARRAAGCTRLVIAAAVVISIATAATNLVAIKSSAATRQIAGHPSPVDTASSVPGSAPPSTPTTTVPTTTAPAAPAVPDTALPALPPAAPDPVVPAAMAPPDAGDFSLIGYRWNPCRVITVESSGPDIAGIVNELVSITGLQLEMVTGPADINVRWGAIAAGADMGLTTWQAVNGWLNGADIVISQQAQPYLATVLRHELAHALGLRHATQADEVMYPGAGPNSPTDYQSGDRAGLSRIGAAAGC